NYDIDLSKYNNFLVIDNIIRAVNLFQDQIIINLKINPNEKIDLHLDIAKSKFDPSSPHNKLISAALRFEFNN
ncbi:hypothetical protein ACW95P_02745, partial [Candidatus Mycoplasma pogonae]